MSVASVAGHEEHVVEIRNLKKSYGNLTAIRDISVKFKRGEFVVLLGPSGVGKSTLLRSINLLVKPTTGEVYVNGADLAKLSQRRLRASRRRIGMIFQEFNLVNRISVLTNVMCGQLANLPPWQALMFRFPQSTRLAAEQALTRVGLPDPDSWLRRADQLSGGQKQRVAIARALVQRPDVLLADEPIASLDVVMRSQIMDLLSDIAREDGITVIMSLHQIDVARKYADRILALSGGEISFDGSPDVLDDAAVERIFRRRTSNAN